jgi:2-amino-4-hydroxy-6-hydroxymethyldihydropteridine diphosphokinase
MPFPKNAGADATATKPAGTIRMPLFSCYIALGANLGNARQTLERTISALGDIPMTRVVCHSSLYRSAPIDATGPDFINAVAKIETQLDPTSLLIRLQQLEQQAGRQRPYRNAPRTLDLDILFYGTLQLNTPQLTLPHPRWQQRAFVVVPLHEIAPELVSHALLQSVCEQIIEKIDS